MAEQDPPEGGLTVEQSFEDFVKTNEGATFALNPAEGLNAAAIAALSARKLAQRGVFDPKWRPDRPARRGFWARLCALLRG